MFWFSFYSLFGVWKIVGILCVRVKTNKCSFEPFCVWVLKFLDLTFSLYQFFRFKIFVSGHSFHRYFSQSLLLVLFLLLFLCKFFFLLNMMAANAIISRMNYYRAFGYSSRLFLSFFHLRFLFLSRSECGCEGGMCVCVCVCVCVCWEREAVRGRGSKCGCMNTL